MMSFQRLEPSIINMTSIIPVQLHNDHEPSRPPRNLSTCREIYKWPVMISHKNNKENFYLDKKRCFTVLSTRTLDFSAWPRSRLFKLSAIAMQRARRFCTWKSYLVWCHKQWSTRRWLMAQNNLAWFREILQGVERGEFTKVLAKISHSRHNYARISSQNISQGVFLRLCRSRWETK